jgi:hypothetical protein
MNKDIRINWNVGMELTPEAFIHLENQLAEYRLLLRKVQASKLFGLIPDTAFKALVSLVGDTLSMAGLECHALLQHGRLVDLKREEGMTMKIQSASDRCYLAVWPTDRERQYERDDVPFIENECQLGFLALEELPGTMPLAKLVQEDGAWKKQDDYILPVMTMDDSPTLKEMAEAIRRLAKQIASHEKFEYLKNCDMMKLLVEEMVCVEGSQHPKDFVVLCRRLARLLSYAIAEVPLDLVDYNPYDIQLFLNSVCSFLIKVHNILPTLEFVELQPVQEEPEEEKEPEDECPIL